MRGIHGLKNIISNFKTFDAENRKMRMASIIRWNHWISKARLQLLVRHQEGNPYLLGKDWLLGDYYTVTEYREMEGEDDIEWRRREK